MTTESYAGRCRACGDEWRERTPPAVCPECHSLDVEGDRMTEFDGLPYVILETAEQADRLVSDALLEECLGWFEDLRGVPERDFLDRLADTYGRAPWDGSGPGFELLSYDNAAARRLLARARRIKREGQS